jgi:hypothetical protein
VNLDIAQRASLGRRNVHYFIDPAAQFRQFREEGLDPQLAADLDGRPVTAGAEAAECPEIHYVARRPLG